MNLYELSNNYRQLQDLIDYEEDVENEVLIDTLESLGDALEDKAENVAKLLKNLQAEEKVIREEAKRLTKKAQSLDNRQKFLKQYLRDAMELSGKTKFKTELFSFNIRKVKDSVVIVDESLVPAEYIIPQPIKINKNELYTLMKKEGMEISGLALEPKDALYIL